MHTQPDFSKLFHTEKVAPLHFEVRAGSNFVHDVHFLSGYLHDACFLPGSFQKRGKKLSFILERSCWELGYVQSEGHLELHAARSRLRIEPVSYVRWETPEIVSPDEQQTIVSIYVGAPHWKTTGASELVILLATPGMNVSISIADDYGAIRLDDLESPHLHSTKKQTKRL